MLDEIEWGVGWIDHVYCQWFFQASYHGILLDHLCVGVTVRVLLRGLLHAHGKVPEMLPHCWARWPIRSDTLSWALELAAMPELTPSVLGKWRTTPPWVIWSNDPKREVASLYLCQVTFIHFEMWGSALVYNWFCVWYHCGYCCYLCKSLTELRYWPVCLLDCQRNSMCFYPVAAETAIWQDLLLGGACI